MIAILSAPTNLGLKPPVPGGVPGASKAPEAFRDAGLYDRLINVGARDAGVVLPGRYVDDDATRASQHLRNEQAIVNHSRRLAHRIKAIQHQGGTPLVLGGDCSLLVGVGLALASDTPPGLIHVDGHTDFRHPANSSECASLAGEDLAAVVGLHWPAVADIDSLGPYFPPARTVHIGCRTNDEDVDEASATLALVVPAGAAIRQGIPTAAATAAAAAGGTYWLHIDVDVLDPQWMPAVDSPDPGGLDPAQLLTLLTALAPGAIGASVSIFDPDLDPDARHAALLVDLLTTGVQKLGTATVDAE